MTKSVIVYASRHHQNTLKLVTAIARKHSIELINAAEITCADLSGYDLIGFASGIDFGKFYRCVELFLEKILWIIRTCFFFTPAQNAMSGLQNLSKKLRSERMLF